MGGRQFAWEVPFEGKLWVADLRISNAPSGEIQSPRFRLGVHGSFTNDHHFGIEVWDQPRNIPTIAPIDVFTTMQSVTSLMSARARTRELRYRR